MKKLRWISVLLLLPLFLSFVPWCVPARAQERPEAATLLWQLVNEARADPLAALAAAGIDEAAARAALGADAGLLDTGLPPLAWDGKLGLAAAGHNREMVERMYYSSAGLDGSTPFERITAFGYEAAAADELLGAMAFDVFLEPADAAVMIFTGWLRDEFDPARTAPRHILNPAWTEVAVDFRDAVIDLDDGLPMNLYVVVADFATPVTPRAFMIGTVYVDADGGGGWTIGEGLAGVGIAFRIDGYSGEGDTVSGCNGVWQYPLVAGTWTIRVTDGQGSAAVYRLTQGYPPQNRRLNLRLR